MTIQMTEEDKIEFNKLPSYYKTNRAFVAGWIANRHRHEDVLNTAITGEF